MRRFVYLLAWGMAIPVLLAAQAQEKTKESPAAGRYRALLREYQTAQSASSTAYAVAKTDAERRAAQALKPDTPLFSRRFLDFARAEPGDRSSFDAISWVLSHSPQSPEGDQSLELLAASHLDDLRLGPILQHLGTSKSPAAEKLLRAAMDKSQDREVQAHACYALISMLTAREHHDSSTRHRTAKAKKSEAAEAPGTKAMSEEIEVLYGRLLKDFRDLKPSRKSKRNYGELALAALGNLKPKTGGSATGSTSFPAGVGLDVGLVAPEIQGQDAIGNPMRLSAFRGRVVVLDFWGDWCPHCREMYPHERTLVNRLEGKPFALLGVNSDKTLEELHAAMEREHVTWPSWFDGGSANGPIASLYGVTGWPAIFVLDPKGVIRVKNARGDDLDKAVDSLLEEFGLTNATLPAAKSKPPARKPRGGESKNSDRSEPGGS